MKGIVFNILEDFVIDTFGLEELNALLQFCPLHTKEPFVGPGTYPDADLFTLVTTICERHNLELDDALTIFGEYAFPKFVAKAPVFLDGIHSAEDFLSIVDSVIHVEVKKLMKDAETPSFYTQKHSDGSFQLDYVSKRQLCPLVKGLIKGAADRFGQEVDIQHTDCLRNGDSQCRFKLKFK